MASSDGSNGHRRCNQSLRDWQKWKAPTLDESYTNNHCLARFFHSSYATFLLHPVARIVVIATFLVYLITAILGCTKIELGLEPYNLLPEHSYGKDSLRIMERYFPGKQISIAWLRIFLMQCTRWCFKESGNFLHVVITNLGELADRPTSSADGSNRQRLWVEISKEIELYEHTEFTGYADSWLRMFMAAANSAHFIITEDNFVPLLKEVSLLTFTTLLKHQ